MERYERAFLATSAVVLVIFLCALGYSSVVMGVHLPSHGAMIHYEAGQKLRGLAGRRRGRDSHRRGAFGSTVRNNP